ncbi:hypothetical protein LX59_03057 [Azomonas agilis]|uniref:Uncharacterized protein n=1 Tax=Azomonas agilis TaxID=116849 RepID=A0A562HYS0_9GAMM|nr:hypothetical protein [Azomonas agilis]TWH63891.1 hypothetical protein LX59_03057 [Azomonas agilis]
MTLKELIADFRNTTRDTIQPYLWADDLVKCWLDGAESEACIRGRLIHESSDAAVCEISVQAGQAIYDLHPSVLEITYLSFDDGSEVRPIALMGAEEMDAQLGIGWRSKEGRVTAAIQTDKRLRLAMVPDADGVLRLECYRLPLRPLSSCGEYAEPELHSAHHPQLVDWALHKAYELPDSETMDLDRSALAERSFSKYFGERPDCDLKRSTRQDIPQHNTCYWV